jgi:DNA-directed RNA polymerase omega subunit
MIHPTIEELSKNRYNRYTLTVTAAKCARLVTDEYVLQREMAERMISRKETDKSINALISQEIRDEKAIKTAIKRLANDDYLIVNAE